MNSFKEIHINNDICYRRAKLLMFYMLFFLLADIFLSGLSGVLSNLFRTHWLALGCSLVLILQLIARIHSFGFIYTHETVTIDIRSLSLMRLLRSTQRHYEFPKRKLVRYTLGPNSWGRQKLTLYLIGSLGEVKKLKSMDITFLSAEKRANLSAALEEIVQGNAEAEG